LSGRKAILLIGMVLAGLLLWMFSGMIGGCSVSLDVGQRAAATALRQYQTVSVCLPIRAGTGYS